MSFTLTQIQETLVTRLSALLSEADKSILDEAILNPDLNDGMSWALRKLGEEPVDFTAVVTADFSGITFSTLDQLLDYAEYRTLQTLFNSLTAVDVKIGHRTEEFSQLANRVGQAVDKTRTFLRKEYGFGRGSIEAGTIDMDITTDADDVIVENVSS